MSVIAKSVLDGINKWLADYYPHYRLVYGPDQFEKRLGTFVKKYPIYSEVTEIREVPKYDFIIPCYILETVAHYEGDEVMNHNGWEICFPFIDVNGNATDPNLEAVQFMMKELLTEKRVTSPKTAEELDRKRFNQEVEKIEETLNN